LYPAPLGRYLSWRINLKPGDGCPAGRGKSNGLADVNLESWDLDLNVYAIKQGGAGAVLVLLDCAVQCRGQVQRARHRRSSPRGNPAFHNGETLPQSEAPCIDKTHAIENRKSGPVKGMGRGRCSMPKEHDPRFGGTALTAATA